MFVGITNTPRDYAWGAPGAMSKLFGGEPTDAPEAELWLGSHPGSPSRIVDPTQAGGSTHLEGFIDLPFLLKVLAAGSPLSLQAHPTPEQAAAGFARENAAGVPRDAPFRNYKHASAKPELIYALSDQFEALCGFRSAVEVHAVLGRLIELDASSVSPDRSSLRRWLDRLGGDESIREVFEWLISRGEGVDELINRVVELAQAHSNEFATVVTLADHYPGDPGIVISLMLHNVTLSRGEALYLPAGNIHAYLSGVGVELMVSSDNVLRGGLTPKHVDVPELMSILDFTPLAVPYLRPALGGDVELFAPEGAPLALARVSGAATLRPTGPAIALCVSGNVEITGSRSSVTLSRGQSVLVTEDEGALAFDGDVFLAAAGISPLG